MSSKGLFIDDITLTCPWTEPTCQHESRRKFPGVTHCPNWWFISCAVQLSSVGRDHLPSIQYGVVQSLRSGLMWDQRWKIFFWTNTITQSSQTEHQQRIKLRISSSILMQTSCFFAAMVVGLLLTGSEDWSSGERGVCFTLLLRSIQVPFKFNSGKWTFTAESFLRHCFMMHSSGTPVLDKGSWSRDDWESLHKASVAGSKCSNKSMP